MTASTPKNVMAQGPQQDTLEAYVSKKSLKEEIPGYLERMIGAIFDDKPELLKAILKSAQDIQPWSIEFADEDLKVNPQAKLFSMFDLAKRCKAWGCIEMLAKIWADFDVEQMLESTLVPAYEEYGELSDGDTGGAELEAFFKATNKGFAKSANGNLQSNEMIHPAYHAAHQRAASFILLDFSKHVLRSKKLSGAENARVALRQRAMGAIASGDANALGVVLEGLRANASALKGAISLDQESLSRIEIETLLTMSVACMEPECMVAVLAKLVSFSRRRKVGRMEMLRAAFGQIGIFLAVLEVRLDATSRSPDPLVVQALCEVVAGLLCQVGDIQIIEGLRQRRGNQLNVMVPCLMQALDHAAANIVGMQIREELDHDEHEVVVMPRERVRL
jgi:hypothetical protein